MSLCAWPRTANLRNVDLQLHRGLDLPTIAQCMKTLSKSYFENAVRFPPAISLSHGALLMASSRARPTLPVTP
ncbi:jg20252 [Pararge aegeria aegeria]|uniref:Jg20252 protein n=1 Tax=Pararge aegeria aegeria TaxID=348720 RepID=A0A8S4R2G8_9NEOP|nr:jg20252 [Pararge aegeria aegeria]